MKETLWTNLSTNHFIFYFLPDSYAFQKRKELAKEREKAYGTLNKVFKVELNDKIRWFFFPSDEEGNKLLGEWSPNQAIPAALTIFTVYNEKHDSTSGHELTHILSFFWNNGLTNSYKFISEGLARYLDQSGRNNHNLAKELKEKGKIIPFSKIISSADFKSADPLTTYIQSASFIEFLITKYGWDKFSKLWLVKNDLSSEMERIYSLSLQTLENLWLEFLN